MDRCDRFGGIDDSLLFFFLLLVILFCNSGVFGCDRDRCWHHKQKGLSVSQETGRPVVPLLLPCTEVAVSWPLRAYTRIPLTGETVCAYSIPVGDLVGIFRRTSSRVNFGEAPVTGSHQHRLSVNRKNHLLFPVNAIAIMNICRIIYWQGGLVKNICSIDMFHRLWRQKQAKISSLEIDIIHFPVFIFVYSETKSR